MIDWCFIGSGGNMLARILIVDDMKFIRETLHQLFSQNNYQVVGEAETGKEAVQLYRELLPDLVTMDLTMPEMSGLEAIKMIRSEFPEAKVIMCSAMGQKKVIMEAIESGAKDYIVKPFNDLQVIEAINRALKS